MTLKNLPGMCVGFLVLVGFFVTAQPVLAQAEAGAEIDTPAGSEVEAWNPYQNFLNRKHFSQFYGQLNLGYLSYDDGQAVADYPLIDNANSGSRIGYRFSRDIGDGWTLGALLEISWTASSTSSANITNREENLDREIYGLRHADLTFEHEGIGKFWIGQGAMASDGASGVDLSGTNVIASSAVADSAGGQLLRTRGGALVPYSIDDVFSVDNGLKRKVRFRYDSVDLGGFDFRASIGKDLLNDDETLLFDIASTYQGELRGGDVEYRAAASVAKPKIAEYLLNGSASALHVPSGLSLTGALALEHNSDRNGRYYYVKTGYQQDFFKFGRTAMSLDVYFGSDVDRADTSSRSYGVSIVQNFDRSRAQFYGTVRNYRYARAGGTKFEDGVAAFSGIRLRF